MEETSVYQPEGNYFDKYNSKNFIIKKMMSGFFASYNDLLNKVRDEINTVMEAGCGEAEVTEFLHDNLNKEIFAFDISDRVIPEAKDRLKNKKINFWVDNIYNISKNEKYDLVVCSEVLEHMDHPEKALSEVKRCSGKYLHFPRWQFSLRIKERVSCERK